MRLRSGLHLPLAVAGDRLWPVGVAVAAAWPTSPWWFSEWRRSERASQYDLPQPADLHSYGFLLRCVSM